MVLGSQAEQVIGKTLQLPIPLRMMRLNHLFSKHCRETPMAEVHHFAYGWITPIMAYSLSVLGSLLGLICTSRALRLATGRKRIGWLVLAAISLGGTGIWVMHFMAMI